MADPAKKELATLSHLSWLGHSSFRIDAPIVIYIDPWRIDDGSPAADLILISHDHYDHCSPEDIAKIRNIDTKLIANPSASRKLTPPVSVFSAGDSIEYRKVIIKATPAYNVDKPYHPRSAGYLGFLITIEGEKIYFAGDTDHIPEMSEIECDLALLPVSGTYVMDPEEASQAAMTLNPTLAIPMHYGAGVAGTLDDAERFKAQSTVPVRILHPEGE
jgi:L-ascorbate metabolism protein UlaG (beta-lactamase superfamily)